MKKYSTLIEAIEGLKTEGYTEDFNLKQNCIECKDRNFELFHDEFEVDKYFRFEGDSDPTDESIIYAISSEKRNVKGILINSFGIYSDPVIDKMLNKLKMPNH